MELPSLWGYEYTGAVWLTSQGASSFDFEVPSQSGQP